MESDARTDPSGEDAVGALLRRALKNHDVIAAALRAGVGGTHRLGKAIDDMRDVKAAAVELGLYPGPMSMLRTPPSASSPEEPT